MLGMVFSCQNPNELRSVRIANTYVFTLPAYMEPAENLHPDAPVQYQNRLKEIYLLARRDEKAPLLQASKYFDLDRYAGFTKDNLLAGLTDGKKVESQPTKLNGLAARYLVLEGMFEGERLRYYLFVVEGKAHYYQLLGWTFANKADAYEADLIRMLRSFELSEGAEVDSET